MKSPRARDLELIESALWTSAGWCDVTYLTPADLPPVLALVFSDRDVAASIFLRWKSALGEIDTADVLRVAVIEGTVPGRPAGYFVHLAPDAEVAGSGALPRDPGQEPGDGGFHDAWHHTRTGGVEHLRRFQAALGRHGRYLLVPAIVQVGLELMPLLGIGKQRVVFRRVSDVGLVGDPDAGLWSL